jgi:triacylglycerol lipase
LVFVNGMIASGETMKPAMDALRADGHDVHIPSLPAAHSLATRAPVLKQQIDEILAKTGARKLNLVGYSLGALDVRQLVSQLGYGAKVASATMLSGPNLGTPVANSAESLLRTMPDGWREKVEQFAGAFGAKYLNPMLEDPELLELAHNLSEEGAREFNAKNPDVSGVFYQSYAALSTTRGNPSRSTQDVCGKVFGDGQVVDIMNPGLTATMLLLAPQLRSEPIDGVIAVSSQKWGEFRGCVPIDHWGIIGSERAPGPDARTGFELAQFYRYLAADLAQRGF